MLFLIDKVQNDIVDWHCCRHCQQTWYFLCEAQPTESIQENNLHQIVHNMRTRKAGESFPCWFTAECPVTCCNEIICERNNISRSESYIFLETEMQQQPINTILDTHSQAPVDTESNKFRCLFIALIYWIKLHLFLIFLQNYTFSLNFNTKRFIMFP